MGIRTTISFLAAALSVTLFAGAAQAETGVTDKEILLGSPHMLSGPSQLYGQQMDVGLNTYFDALNEKGGVYGRKVHLVSLDDKYEPDAAIACFNQLRQQGVFAITGIIGSPTSAKYLPMAETFKVPIVGCYSGPMFVTDPVKPYTFTTRATYHDEIREAVNHLWTIGARKFAVFFQNDAYGADELEGVKATLKEHHAEIVAAGSYTRNSAKGIVDAYNEVKAANPEVVVLASVYKPSAEVVFKANEENWHPIFVMNSGDGPDAFLSTAHSNADGMLISEVAPLPTSDTPAVQEYLKALRKFFPNEKPTFLSLKAYMDAMALTEGLKRAGHDLTRDNFLQAMNSIRKVDVGLGKGWELNYTPTDHMGWRKVFFAQIKNGQFVAFTDWNSLKQRLSFKK